MTINILNKIINQKQCEIMLIDRDAVNHALEQALQSKQHREAKSFKAALTAKTTTTIAVIAEIKKQSPSQRVIANIADPIDLAKKYMLGGASAISVLTDRKFFGGSLPDLAQVASALRHSTCAILRKDFIIDEIQIAESVIAGADAVLLIVSILQHQTKKLLDIAKHMKIDALVEVHNREELMIAIDSGAEIIAVNNRDLKTFEVNINRSLELAPLIPNSLIAVAASGINSPATAAQLKATGFDALLIGEALVRAHDPAQLIKKFIGYTR